MINSNAFSYINVLDKAADASWVRNTVLANNIANASTPNYKRQDVRFESMLEKELKRAGSLDNRIASLKLNNITASTYTDMSTYSYRLDGNNVDMATEQAELASNQLKYNALNDAINSEFTKMRTAMS
ncbi:MAG: flagellar basal body rod protein FlgB [Lachnospiraceae bacterium]|nr:flagellar basal body rod protein FlgB [Lachnospiraceae bacterium]